MYAGLITNPMTPSDLQIPQKSPKHFAKNLTSPIIPIHLSIQARNLLRMLEFTFSLLFDLKNAKLNQDLKFLKQLCICKYKIQS